MKNSRLRLFINNQDVLAARGITVADALQALNSAVQGPGQRGPERPLCGIGRCNDCVVTVDGVPGVKGCLTRIRADMRISTEAQVE